MTPAEPPEPVEPAGPPERSPAPPESSEQYAVFLRYRARGRALRERRGRQLRIAVGALVAGACLLTAVLFWTRHQRPPVTARTIEPPAVLSRESAESPAAQLDPSAAQDRAAATTKEPARPESTPSSTPPPSSTPTPKPTPTPLATGVSYQPRERLTTVRAGDAKEAVFELFGTAIERRNGSLVRIEGMRLRATGRSPQHAQVEVAEVRIADPASGSLYWFLFGDGWLVAWGRPEEWAVATGRYQIEIDYQPDPSPARPGAWRRPWPDDLAGRHAFGSQGSGPDLDYRVHHAQPRLHDLRHALRPGRKGRGPSAATPSACRSPAGPSTA